MLWVAALCALTPWVVAHEREAEACAPAPMAGEEVFIAEEAAVIHWDPARRIETFIRRARFDTRAKDFGFLVPTPSVPTLSAASEALFTTLDDAIRPEVVDRTERDFQVGISCLMLTARSARTAVPQSSAPMPAAQSAAVQVLAAQTVAGYDAVVLEASSPEALSQWLGSHGYASSPSLTRWLTPYVANHWKITAFRVQAPDRNNPAPPATSPVRMTFATDRPFYPYREPEEQQRPRAGSSRSLRVHVLSSSPMEGTVGTSGAWPGAVRFRSNPANLAARVGALAGVQLASGVWLSTFDDLSSPRPGTDEVFFSSVSEQRRFTPPPIVRVHRDTIPIMLDWIAAVIVVVVVIVRRVRKKK